TVACGVVSWSGGVVPRCNTARSYRQNPYANATDAAAPTSIIASAWPYGGSSSRPPEKDRCYQKASQNRPDSFEFTAAEPLEPRGTARRTATRSLAHRPDEQGVDPMLTKQDCPLEWPTPALHRHRRRAYRIPTSPRPVASSSA